MEYKTPLEEALQLLLEEEIAKLPDLEDLPPIPEDMDERLRAALGIPPKNAE